MTDFEKYESEYQDAKEYFEKQISDRENKAFEYGTIVVRNAVLISGGGLLAVPTIVSLASEIKVNIDYALKAGCFFAGALLLAILGAYVIHINWMLHVAAWEKHWKDRRDYLDKRYLKELPHDQLSLEVNKHYGKSLFITFIFPHFLAISFLISSILGFYFLYGSLGVFGE